MKMGQLCKFNRIVDVTVIAARKENAVSCQISNEPQPLDIVHAVRYKYGTYLEKFTGIAVSW
jgi:hypothetical protein